MHLRTKRDRLSRCYRRTRHAENGSKENTRSSRLVPANHCYRGTPIPRIHRVLSVLHPKLFKNRPTTPGSYKKDNPMALGPTPVQSVRHSKDPYVSKTRATPAQLRKTFLPPN